MGRFARLESPLPLYEVIHRVKQHLDLTHVRLAMSSKHNRGDCFFNGCSFLLINILIFKIRKYQRLQFVLDLERAF